MVSGGAWVLRNENFTLDGLEPIGRCRWLSITELLPSCRKPTAPSMVDYDLVDLTIVNNITVSASVRRNEFETAVTCRILMPIFLRHLQPHFNSERHD